MNRDTFVRWQDNTRAQFTSLSYVVLTLATGLLAFESSQLSGKKATLAVGFLPRAAFFLLIGSIASAIVCGLTRLLDSRFTAQIARGDPERGHLRTRVKRLGIATWWLLGVQLLLFVLGAIAVGARVL